MLRLSRLEVRSRRRALSRRTANCFFKQGPVQRNGNQSKTCSHSRPGAECLVFEEQMLRACRSQTWQGHRRGGRALSHKSPRLSAQCSRNSHNSQLAILLCASLRVDLKACLGLVVSWPRLGTAESCELCPATACIAEAIRSCLTRNSLYARRQSSPS